MGTTMADVQRCVISARIIGVMQRAVPKIKMFMISVKWSDQREVTVYRLFHDFEKFHRQLKRLAAANPPEEAAGHKRMIPKFKTRAMRSSLQHKSCSRSVSRMRFLSLYCSELLRCDATVTQSSELTQFFVARKHDLEPDFTKNSIMVLLSEDRSEVTDVQPRGSVTYPFVTQTYRCVADYETTDTTNQPFNVVKNQKLDVLIKEPTGWWLVEQEDKRLAWFPAPYLEKCEDDEDVEVEVLSGDKWIRKDSQDGHISQKTGMYCAIRNYSTEVQDELSLTVGSVVERLKKSDDGWWLVRYKGKEGYVPSLCLEPYHQQRSRLESLIGKLPSSSTLNMAANGLQNVSRGGTFFSASFPEEPNSPNGSGRTKQLHSDLSLDRYKRSVSMEFSTVSNVSSTLSSYSSMSSVENGISTYKPRLFRGLSDDHPGHISSSESRMSDGERFSPDLSPTDHLRVVQGQDQDHPDHTSSQARMSDGERSSPYLSATDLPHPGTGSDSSGSDMSKDSKTEPPKMENQDHSGHTSSSQSKMSDGERSSPDLSPTDLPHPGKGSDGGHASPDLRLSQDQDHTDHTSSSHPCTSSGGHASPDLRLSQDQDHPDHTPSSQYRMSDGEHSSPVLSPTDLPYPGTGSDGKHASPDLRLSQGKHQDHSGHTASSQSKMSDGERSVPDLSPTYDLRLAQELQCKDLTDHTSSQARMSDGERSSPDLSPTDLPHPGTGSDGGHASPDLRLSQEQYQDHPGHTSSSQSKMNDGERSNPDLCPSDLPHPGTGSNSSGSDTSKDSKAELLASQEPPKVEDQDHSAHTSSSQPCTSNGGGHTSPDLSSTYDLRLAQEQQCQDHPDHTPSSQSMMSDGERSSPDLSPTDLPHPGTGSDSSDRSKGSKVELVAPQEPPKVVFIVASVVQVQQRKISSSSAP